MKTDYQRLLALDVFRGITIAGMILVNNPGSWNNVYAPLKHVPWHGLTPTDLVFPFFMFIMGISTYISLKKYEFEFSRSSIWKIVKRTCVIFAIGLGIAWLSLFFLTWNSLVKDNLTFFSHLRQSICVFDQLRILGVLQRLALSYGFAAIIVILLKHKYIPYLIGVLLISYFLILIFGNGFEYNETNILSIVDRAVLGLNHILDDHKIDPEGILSTIPSIAHVLLGFYCGKWLMEEKDIRDKLLYLFLFGTVLISSGFLFSFGCPLNKKIWSPTFVLFTCGLASSILALFIWIIDVKGHKKWSRFFEAFGVNPLFMYTLAAIVSILLRNITFKYNEATTNIRDYIYKELLLPLFGNYQGSLVYSLLFVCLIWVCGYVLYKKKIYIKI